MSIDPRPGHLAVAPGLQPTWGRQAAAAPVGLPLLAAISIHLLVFGSLFTGLPGPAALGELRGEGTVLGSLAIMLSAVLSGVALDLRGLKSALIFLPLAVCIGLSFAFNAEQIAAAHFLGREGGEKFFTSLLVIGFYFSVFYAVACIAHVFGVRATLLCASDAAVWCGFLMLAEMAVEIVSWVVPPLREAWRSVRGLWVEAGSSAPMYRLVGFAPEPSLSAITSMGLLGLLAGEGVLRRGSGWPRPRSLAVGFLILALFTLEFFLANARTFSIGVFGALVAAFFVSPFARLVPAALKSAAIVLGPMPVQAALVWVSSQHEVSARSISDITRSVGMITASELWARNPLFGLGLGQYGFHFRSVVPSWAMGSFEVSKYFREDQYELIRSLPPSYSMFSRVAAELGLVGLVAWLFPPFFAMRHALVQRPGALTSVIICALAAQIWTGLSFDSFRNVYYWLWLALLLAWPSQTTGLAASRFAAH